MVFSGRSLRYRQDDGTMPAISPGRYILRALIAESVWWVPEHVCRQNNPLRRMVFKEENQSFQDLKCWVIICEMKLVSQKDQSSFYPGHRLIYEIHHQANFPPIWPWPDTGLMVHTGLRKVNNINSFAGSMRDSPGRKVKRLQSPANASPFSCSMLASTGLSNSSNTSPPANVFQKYAGQHDWHRKKFDSQTGLKFSPW